MSYSIRPARENDAEALGHLHVAVWRQAYAGIMPDDFLAALSPESRAAMWAKTLREGDSGGLTVFVAETPDRRLIGFAVGGPCRDKQPGFDGELWAVNIDAAWHRRGVGRALCAATARWLDAKGFNAMLLWVLEANPARGFYERLGAHRLPAAKPARFGSGTLSELAYGFPSLPDLVRRLSAESGA